jgi:hydrogenase small subunit
MVVSRRQFLDYCKNAAAAVGLGAAQLAQLEKALAAPNAPSVIWLSGSSCTGCSISFLNRIAPAAPATAADVLINVINLRYHPNLRAAAGESAVAVALDTMRTGNYILAVEGGVPTAFGGNACWAWSTGGADVTFLEAVRMLAARASQVLCIGTCASFGGIPAAPPNPAGIKTVKAATLLNTVNVAGCPPHPDWMVATIAGVLSSTLGALDSYGRPVSLFRRTVHNQCPRRERGEAHTYGQDGQCLEELGCLGPDTMAPCPTTLWNNRVNWCVDANSQCLGCTNPNFPRSPLRRSANANND